MVHIIEKCDFFFSSEPSQIFFKTGTTDSSLSLFALFVIRLVTLSDVLTLLWTLNNSIDWNMHYETWWKQFLNYMLLRKIEFNKVRTWDSFTLCTLVDLLLSVTSTSELVSLTFIGSISAEFILFVSLSACRLCLFCLSAHRLGSFCLSAKVVRACQTPEKSCGKVKWKSENISASNVVDKDNDGCDFS